MEKSKALKPGEIEIVSSEYGTYKRYYLSEQELHKYRELPQDTYWDHNSKPHDTPTRKTKGA
ncbi:hypothetical protein [Paenibacillus graminis]|uniref:hypothetical protein n=1 Tax=Paenibacillus graminis TaxID=189425 RepID=UPI002DBAA139|nr:hypothetical protein [Paenibacillus graminis]MEC0170296.1 hypothetical protein [Paenibacillus graminis]